MDRADDDAWDADTDPVLDYAMFAVVWKELSREIE